MIEFLSTTDPMLVVDWIMTFLISVSTLFATVLGGSLVIKEVIEIWGLDKWQQKDKEVGEMIEIGENLMYAISAVAFFGFLAVIMKD